MPDSAPAGNQTDDGRPGGKTEKSYLPRVQDSRQLAPLIVDRDEYDFALALAVRSLVPARATQLLPTVCAGWSREHET